MKKRGLLVMGIVALPLCVSAQAFSTSSVSTSTDPVMPNSSLFDVAPTSATTSIDQTASSSVQSASSTDDQASSSAPTFEDRPYAYISGPHCLRFTRTLSIGSRGSDVTALQKELIQLGFLAPTNVTGTFGPLTQTAVMELQSAYSISSTTNGIVGPKTRQFFTLMCPLPTVTNTSTVDSTNTVMTQTTATTPAPSTPTSTSTDATQGTEIVTPTASFLPPQQAQVDQLRELVNTVQQYYANANASQQYTQPTCTGPATQDGQYLDSILGISPCLLIPQGNLGVTPYQRTVTNTQPTTIHVIISTSTTP